jgi:FkbM family methyltransferase
MLANLVLNSNSYAKWRWKTLKCISQASNISDKLIAALFFMTSLFPRRYLYDLQIKILKKIRFNFDGNLFYANSINEMNFINNNFEREIQEWFQCPKDGVFIDVGANIGRYVIQLADKVDKIIAFEPSPDTFKTLNKNIELNKISNVETYQVALWNKDETLDFHIYPSSGSNSVNLISSIIVKKIMVQGKRFKTLIDKGIVKINRLDLVKIDIEGSEYEAIQGMEVILKTYYPRMIVEIKEQNENKVIKKLRRMGYKLINKVEENYLFAA